MVFGLARIRIGCHETEPNKLQAELTEAYLNHSSSFHPKNFSSQASIRQLGIRDYFSESFVSVVTPARVARIQWSVNSECTITRPFGMWQLTQLSFATGHTADRLRTSSR